MSHEDRIKFKPIGGIVVLTDLTGMILLLSSGLLLLGLELTRRRILRLNEITFVLCSMYGILSIGGFLDHQFSDEELSNLVYSRPSFFSIPAAISVGLTLGMIARLWFCTCICCCLVGKKSESHNTCRAHRVKSNIPVFLTSFCMILFSMGARLNARLRHSSIQPSGGTLHWHILKNPHLVHVTYWASAAMVFLHLFFEHVGSFLDRDF